MGWWHGVNDLEDLALLVLGASAFACLVVLLFAWSMAKSYDKIDPWER